MEIQRKELNGGEIIGPYAEAYSKEKGKRKWANVRRR